MNIKLCKNRNNDKILSLETGIVPEIGEIIIIDNKQYCVKNRIRVLKNIYNLATSTEDFIIEIEEII